VIPERFIRRKHKEDVQKAIMDSGLNLDDFVFRESHVHKNNLMSGIEITVLEHEPSESFFSFDYGGNNFDKLISKRKPGTDSPIETSRYFKNWQEQLDYLKEWLELVREEIEAVDWQEIRDRENKLLQSSTSISENSKFTDTEKAVIYSTLDEIHNLVVASLKAQELSDMERQARLDHIAEEVKYLKEGADRLGKKDWINTAIGAMVGIASNLVVSAEARLTVGKLLKGLVDYIIQSPNLLGY
jgi:hypothetical protein